MHSLTQFFTYAQAIGDPPEYPWSQSPRNAKQPPAKCTQCEITKKEIDFTAQILLGKLTPRASSEQFLTRNAKSNTAKTCLLAALLSSIRFCKSNSHRGKILRTTPIKPSTNSKCTKKKLCPELNWCGGGVTNHTWSYFGGINRNYLKPIISNTESTATNLQLRRHSRCSDRERFPSRTNSEAPSTPGVRIEIGDCQKYALCLSVCAHVPDTSWTCWEEKSSIVRVQN